MNYYVLTVIIGILLEHWILLQIWYKTFNSDQDEIERLTSENNMLKSEDVKLRLQLKEAKDDIESLETKSIRSPKTYRKPRK
jgi:hypothetical protein